MKRLYAPWRNNYITDARKKSGEPGSLKEGCVFCVRFDQDDDEKNYILKRFTDAIVVMNSYPYNKGHLMVLPRVHKADFRDLNAKVRGEVMEAISMSLSVLEDAIACEGFNVGVNLGKAGGGGIPGHLHVHIVPRWLNDTNFLEITADVRLISFEMETTYTILREAFKKVSG